MFRFECQTCGEIHDGMPAFGWAHPIQYLAVAEAERDKRCFLTTDTCVIDGQWFFVRGCLEIPVEGLDDAFSWGVWVSLSEKNFIRFEDLVDVDRRDAEGPYFGWLATFIPPYPDTTNLKTMVHLRNSGLRPYIELEPTDHPLAIEQRHGISQGRVSEIIEQVMHREA